MQTRREFLGASAVAATTLASGALRAASRPTKDDISLAAWSINRSFFAAKKWKNLDLPRIAREEFNVNGLEFVQFVARLFLSLLQSVTGFWLRYLWARVLS